MLTFYHSFQQFAQAGIGSVLEKQVTRMSWHAVGVGTLALIVLIIIASFTRERYPKLNKALYIMILISVIVPTLTLVGSTIYLNSQSYQGGPVHWHADIEFWACGNELELRDPKGALSNKIGSPTLHEHNDKRIHLEGVPITDQDASLGKFMKTVGGKVDSNNLIVPVNSNNVFENDYDGDGKFTDLNYLIDDRFITDGFNGKVAKFETGKNGCASTEPAEVQVFVYRMKGDNTYEQTKVEKPDELVISPDSSVPPGDCIIMEYDLRKDFTDKLCEQFGVRTKNKCRQFGVEDSQMKVCELTDVTDYKSGKQPDEPTDNEQSDVGDDNPVELEEKATL